MSRITVFGGSGFMGRHLIRRLAANGWEIRVACRDLEASHLLKPAGEIGQIVPWCCDISKPGHVAAAVEGADAVVNLVGALYESRRNRFEGVHVEGPRAIAEAARAAGISTFVHVSALGADIDSESRYARTKAAGEQVIKEIFPGVVILRPSVLFGPEDKFFNRFAGMTRISPVLPVFGCPMLPELKSDDEGFRLDFYGNGGTQFQPVYVGDVADAIMAGLSSQEARGKTFELGGPKVYGFTQLMEMLLRYTNRKRLLVPVPFFVAEFYATFLQMLPKPVLTRDQVTLLQTDNVVSDGACGLADLGIAATTIESILPTYMSRFRLSNRQDTQNA